MPYCTMYTVVADAERNICIFKQFPFLITFIIVVSILGGTRWHAILHYTCIFKWMRLKHVYDHFQALGISICYSCARPCFS